MTTDTLTAPIPSTLPDVHQTSFASLADVPARLRTAIERVIREAQENSGPGGISAFNSSI